MSIMSENTKKSLESSLQQLKCHFTWNLMEGEQSLDEFENRVLNKCELQNSEFKATMCNIQAYIKHHRGQNEAALECLQQAEELIQRQHAGQAEIRSLVTWGNYAWVYYHMGRLSEAQIYVDKVKEVCAKCSSPYRIESPELDCEEGWTRLKCTKQQNERGKVCFEKALEKDPKNPEFFTGWAIENYRLDRWPASQNPIDALRTAIELNPDNQYMKVLLALKLQKLNEEDEESKGDRLVEEALREAEGATDVLCSAAKFYRNKRAVDKSINLLREALKSMPDDAYLHYHIGCCYRSKVQRMLSMRDRGMNGKSEFLELTQQAVHHLKRADEINGNLLNVCSHLAGIFSMVGQYEEAEFYFQKELSKEHAPIAKQLLHLRYGNFQLYQMKCEDKAIQQFKEGVKINQESKEKEKMKSKLQRIAQGRLSKNEADSEALHLLAFLQEFNGGEMQQVDADTERDASTGSCVPLASLDETGNEE